MDMFVCLDEAAWAWWDEGEFMRSVKPMHICGNAVERISDAFHTRLSCMSCMSLCIAVTRAHFSMHPCLCINAGLYIEYKSLCCRSIFYVQLCFIMTYKMSM